MDLVIQSPSVLLPELASLMRASGQNYYRRIQIADQILQNKDWVLESFRGDPHKAADVLEEKYFHDLCGVVSIWDLMQIYRRFPEEKDWESYGYNLRVMLDKLHVPGNKNSNKARDVKRATIKQLEETQTQAKDYKYRFEMASEKLIAAKAMIGQLKENITDLQKENAALRRERDKYKDKAVSLEQRSGSAFRWNNNNKNLV